MRRYIVIGLIILLSMQVAVFANEQGCIVVAPKEYENAGPLPLLIIIAEKDASLQALSDALRPLAERHNCIIACVQRPDYSEPANLTARAQEMLSKITAEIMSKQLQMRADGIFVVGFSLSSNEAVKTAALQEGLFNGIVLLAPSSLDDSALTAKGMSNTPVYLLQYSDGKVKYDVKLKELGFKNVVCNEVNPSKNTRPDMDDWGVIIGWVNKLIQPKECYVVLPDNYDNTSALPALIAFHGFGTNARAYSERMKEVANKYGYLVLCPTLPDTMLPQQVAEKGENILKAVEAELLNYKVDKANVLISSVSFSGMAVARIASLKPDMFKGVIITAPSRAPETDDLKKIGLNKPIYVWQGSNDRLIASGKKLNTMLQEMEHKNFTYKEAEGLGHQTPPVDHWGEIFDWINK